MKHDHWEYRLVREVWYDTRECWVPQERVFPGEMTTEQIANNLRIYDRERPDHPVAGEYGRAWFERRPIGPWARVVD